MTDKIKIRLKEEGLVRFLEGRAGGRKSPKFIKTLLTRVCSLVQFFHGKSVNHTILIGVFLSIKINLLIRHSMNKKLS